MQNTKKINKFENILLEEVNENNEDTFENLFKKIFLLRFRKSLYQQQPEYKISQCFLVYKKTESETEYIGILTYAIEKEYVYIFSLGVIEKYRREGIGTYLLKKVENEALKFKIKIIKLHTQTSNMNVLDFYVENGFKVINVIKNYYNYHFIPSAYLLCKTL